MLCDPVFDSVRSWRTSMSPTPSAPSAIPRVRRSAAMAAVAPHRRCAARPLGGLRCRRRRPARRLRWRRRRAGDAATDATVKFGINEAEGAGPAYDRLAAMAEAYAKEAGVDGRRQRGRPQHLPGEHQHLPPGQARRRLHLVRRLPDEAVRRAGPDLRRQRRVADRRPQRRVQEGLDRARRQAVLRAGQLLPVGGLLPEVGLREERLRRRRRRSTSSTR